MKQMQPARSFVIGQPPVQKGRTGIYITDGKKTRKQNKIKSRLQRKFMESAEAQKPDTVSVLDIIQAGVSPALKNQAITFAIQQLQLRKLQQAGEEPKF